MANLWVSASIAAAGSFMVIGTAAAGPVSDRSPQLAETADLSDDWQPISAEEEERFWDYVLQSPLGIAALNQLAVEGFISPTCDKKLYSHAEYGTFQTLMHIDCGRPIAGRGGRAFGEVRVTFNRFEDVIASFEIEPVYDED